MKQRLFGSGLAVIVLIAAWTVTGQAVTPKESRVPEYTFEVVRQLPHDSTAFTQGFTYHNGFFYEGP